MRFFLGDDLVLLFRRGDKYHSFHEGLLPHSCPMLMDEPDTKEELLERHRSCVSTALHRIVPVDGPVPSTEKGGHNRQLPQLRAGDELIWRGVPSTGYIGIDSSGACDRIARFAPDYVCRDGRTVLTEDSQPIIFPVQDPTNNFMQALIEGTLTLRERCLYLSVDEPYDLVLPVWPHGFSYDNADGNVSVFDTNNQTVAQTGSSVSMGGGMFGEKGSPLPAELRKRVESCDGPYWIVGEIAEAS